jgi:hypothetical protein
MKIKDQMKGHFIEFHMNIVSITMLNMFGVISPGNSNHIQSFVELTPHFVEGS